MHLKSACTFTEEAKKLIDGLGNCGGTYFPS